MTTARKATAGLIVTLSALGFLNGCASSFSMNPFDDKPMPEKPRMQQSQHASIHGFEYRQDSHDQWLDAQDYDRRHANTVMVHKRLADYADQLAMQLMDRAFSLKQSDKITVASFVKLNASLREPTVLGNRLAEAMIRELQHYGLAVVDTKLSADYAITPRGDLALSRDKYLLKSELNVDYVLTGTLIERPNGVEVNARVIGVKEHQIAASANLFIPGIVVANESQYSSIY